VQKQKQLLKMMSSKNNGFTASDIERYHSGQMPAAERHALEKAALDDPFLADALEGYAFTSTPSVDLSNIQLRLNEKLNRKKVVPFFQKYKWISAAAIFIIIAAGGWIAYTISDKSKETSVAVQKNKPATEQQQSVPARDLSTDSVKSQVTTSTADKRIETSKIIDSKQNDASATHPPIRQANEEVASRPIELAMERDRQQARSKAKTLPAPLNEININNALAAQRKDINQINRDTLHLNAGYVSGVTLQKNILKDSASYATAAPIRVRGTVPADSVTNLNIVLKPLPMDSAETVVIGYGTEKKAKERYPKVTIDTLEPAEGYVNFDDYVANNLKVPEELRTKTISGEVQLSFDVDKNGQPTNIAVVKSLCQKCDEEAIRLLKEGPKWKKKKNQKGKITIKF
jgi:TonB family protein